MDVAWVAPHVRHLLDCAPAIYGAASAFMSAKRLGHSVTVAEKHYVGIVKVSPEARTIEQAMQV